MFCRTALRSVLTTVPRSNYRCFSQQLVQPDEHQQQQQQLQQQQVDYDQLQYDKGYYNSIDNYINEDLRDRTSGDPTNRTFNYLMIGGAKAALGSLGRLAVIKFVASLSASADVMALASLEVDLKGIQEGQCMTVKWRGKPVFIRHRTAREIEQAVADDNDASLRDVQKDADRIKAGYQQWLVVMGICTHLGCVPVVNAGDYNGWFCPCHGSHYDLSGRIRKGPAPLNLEVPPYQFTSDTGILIG